MRPSRRLRLGGWQPGAVGRGVTLPVLLETVAFAASGSLLAHRVLTLAANALVIPYLAKLRPILRTAQGVIREIIGERPWTAEGDPVAIESILRDGAETKGLIGVVAGGFRDDGATPAWAVGFGFRDLDER